jgi:hypothetical protein
MPDQAGGGCVFYEFGAPWFSRPNMPQHSFAGSNTWVIDAVRHQMGKDADALGLTAGRAETSKARNVQMLRDASDMEVTVTPAGLSVRVINQSGHKLPSGYPEGRRMWVNVRFLGEGGTTVAEHGAYDHATAELGGLPTKVYEAKHGIDEAVAAATGLPAGINFHLALANTKYLDNRIPPRGFTNAAFEADGCQPVNYAYADGQHWDDTVFAIPAGATSAVVTLYYQTTSKEYIEFLRDENVTNTAGQVAYDLWAMFGKSAPVDMDAVSVTIKTGNPADLNGDGTVNGQDLGVLLSNWGNPGTGDLNGDGSVNGQDLGVLLSNWG